MVRRDCGGSPVTGPGRQTQQSLRDWDDGNYGFLSAGSVQGPITYPDLLCVTCSDGQVSEWCGSYEIVKNIAGKAMHEDPKKPSYNTRGPPVGGKYTSPRGKYTWTTRWVKQMPASQPHFLERSHGSNDRSSVWWMHRESDLQQCLQGKVCQQFTASPRQSFPVDDEWQCSDGVIRQFRITPFSLTLSDLAKERDLRKLFKK